MMNLWQAMPTTLNNRNSCRGESCIRPDGAHLVGRSPRPGRTQGSPLEKIPLAGTTTGSIGRIVQAFKSITTRQYLRGIREYGWQPFPGKLWQRNYYERIVRDEGEWERIREYITINPGQWAMDRENREAGKTRGDEPWQV